MPLKTHMLHSAGRPGMAVVPQGTERVLSLFGGERRVRCPGCLPSRNAGASSCPEAEPLGAFELHADVRARWMPPMHSHAAVRPHVMPM
jgi:hypothetical protein